MIEQIYLSSEVVAPRTLESVSYMIDEEYGELARAINRPYRCTEPAQAEIADLIICLADLLWLQRDDMKIPTTVDLRRWATLDIEDNEKDISPSESIKNRSLYEQVRQVKYFVSLINVYDPDHGDQQMFIKQAIWEAFVVAMHLEPSHTVEDTINTLTGHIKTKCQKWESQCRP